MDTESVNIEDYNLDVIVPLSINLNFWTKLEVTNYLTCLFYKVQNKNAEFMLFVFKIVL